MTQEIKKQFFMMEDELDCPHCKKTINVGFDYNVIIESPEDQYIELENGGIQVIKNE